MKAESMAIDRDNEGSGNDGSWFLEAVGAVPPPATPSETVAALELDNTLTHVIDDQPGLSTLAATRTFDGDTGTSTSTYETARGSIAVDDAPTLDAPPVEVDLSPIHGPRRMFRWSMVVFGILLLTVAAIAAYWIPASARQEAVSVKQSYADDASALRQYLPTAQSALGTMTDPATPQSELAAVVPTISSLESLAAMFRSTATQPLSSPMPLLPNSEVAALKPLQDTAQIRAAQASDIARSLGSVYVYRTTVAALLVTDNLPTVADTQTINALSLSLATSLVQDSNAISDLPRTEMSDSLNNAALASIARYASWQEEYLSALSEGDETGTARLVAELDDIRTSLDTQLSAMLVVARSDIDQRIVDLASDLEVFLTELTSP